MLKQTDSIRSFEGSDEEFFWMKRPFSNGLNKIMLARGCNMKEHPYIKCPRQRRAIQALLEQPIAVKNLGPKIGALNPRQTVSELRRQGFEGIIVTRRFTVVDRDGKICHPGEYFVSQEHKQILEEALSEFESAMINQISNPDNNGRA
jgi:hypothetical protein